MLYCKKIYILNTEDMKQPNSYTDRKTARNTDKFLFISYAHRDQAFVYESLCILEERGLNFWYDKELNIGDEWDERVAKVIRHEDCVGVLFFVSVHSVLSAAVEKEILLTEEIKKDRPEFFTAHISVNGKRINTVVRDTYVSLGDKDEKELEALLPQARAMNVLRCFTDKTLIIMANGDNAALSAAGTLIESIQKLGLDVLCNTESNFELLRARLGLNETGGVFSAQLGSYPQGQYFGDGLYREGEWDAPNKVRLFGRNERMFRFAPVDWLFLSIDGDTAEFVSEKCLDCVPYKDIDAFLSEFSLRCFSGETHFEVESVRVLTEVDVEKIQELSSGFELTDFAQSKAASAYLFSFDNGRGCFLNEKYKKLSFIPVTPSSVCTIRPVVKVKIKINEG